MLRRNLMAAATLSFCPFLCTSCIEGEGNPAVYQNQQIPGDARVMIKTGKVGALLKASDITLASLAISLTASGEAPVAIAFDLSGNGPSQVSHTFTGLASMKTWSMVATSTDQSGQVIHSGSTSFEVLPRRTTAVNLDLPARYSMLKASFLPVLDSVIRCELFVDDVLRSDSAFEKQGKLGDTIPLAFDYLSTGVDHALRLDVYGEMWGIDTLLYRGATTLNVPAGQDVSQRLTLAWVGPGQPPVGSADMSVSLGGISTVTVLGELEGRGAFNEEFNSAALDTAWHVYDFSGTRSNSLVSPANHFSLSDATGALRYYLDPMTHGDGFLNGYLTTSGQHSCCSHDPGQEVFRSLNGDQWILETKVTYFMPISNGRTLDIRVYFGDGGLNTYYAGFMRGRDTEYNEISAFIVRKDGPDPVDFTYLDRLPIRTYSYGGTEGDLAIIHYRIVRDGSMLRLLWSDNGSEWNGIVSRDLGAGLEGAAQRVTLTGLSWFNSVGSYAEYDYLRFTR